MISWTNIKFYLNHSKIQLLLIVLLALGLRLYKINNPILDWHAWRQADTASVTREFVKNGVDLLQPQYHDLSDVPSGTANPEGYRMVEFPLVNALTAALIRAIPTLDLVITSRFISVLFSLGAILALYWLVRQISGHKIALLSSLAYACLPFSVFYSRATLPEPALLAASTLSLAAFTAYLRRRKIKFWMISAAALILALLLKPFAAFTAPVYLALALIYNQKFYRDPWFYVLPVIGIMPLLGWRAWIQQFPAGIPASRWLFNATKIRFRPAWFRWIFWERITKLILGVSGLFLTAFNWRKIDRSLTVILAWSLGMLGYVSIIATGNVRHDYYQNLLLPLIAFALGRGTYYFYQLVQIKLHQFLQSRSQQLSGFINKQLGLFTLVKISRRAAQLITLLILTSAVLISWTHIKGYYQINQPKYITAGKAADKLLPADAKVIAPAAGDTMFLFQTNRRGWPIGTDIETKIDQGATHYITINPDDSVAQHLQERYATVKQTQDYLIINLTQPKQDE